MTREFDRTASIGRTRGAAIGPATSRRNLFKFAGAGVLAIGAGSLLAACGGNEAVGGASTKAEGALATPTPFTVGSSSGDNFLIDVVNVDQNQFAPYNLEVPKFIYPQSVVQGMQMVSAGAIEGAAMDTMLAMLSFANGQKGNRPVIVGMRMPVNTYNMIVGPGSWPDQGAGFVEKMGSLKGKKIGVTAIGAGTDRQLDLALKAAGMERGDITAVAVGQIPAAIAQIKNGRLDAYVGFTYGSGLSVATQVQGQMLIDFSGGDTPELLSALQVCPLVMREDNAEAHEDVANAWLAAQWDAKTWIEKNRAAAAALLNAGTFNNEAPVEAGKAIDFMVDRAFPKVSPNWKVTRGGIEHVADVMDQLGMLKKGTVSYEDIVPPFARA
ncbi:ABC-type nitrate/sulfonate/bicarbonate transport system, substrate-binding protein [Rhodococcus tukisamuensis]|uniref:ABC-type nitrate/sulfonate/bicarbonate transport system, substrate-binding protein n=2 Tax=Rhodococcus tukisamuensis TaxID=168276 RepID=A0A1G7EQN2_9NOCA|nr:ABC-type nitrate/sulfonate/bicarbonate transport system, substrate-binding protein [Rhodococcus tukisamuensis]